MFEKEIEERLKQMHEEGMTYQEIAQRTGISLTVVSNAINGGRKIKNASVDLYLKVFPEKKKVLEVADEPERILRDDEIFDRKRIMTHGDFGEDAEVVPVDRSTKFKAVPILSIAQAAGYDQAVEPLCDYLREVTDETALFFDVRENYFALRVSGDSMSPDYPDGSIALVASGEYPQRGDIVAAKLTSGQVVIKEYHRKDNIITLQSINPHGKSFEWNCKSERLVEWMWPVIEITLKPRSQRWVTKTEGE